MRRSSKPKLDGFRLDLMTPRCRLEVTEENRSWSLPTPSASCQKWNGFVAT